MFSTVVKNRQIRVVFRKVKKGQIRVVLRKGEKEKD